MNPRPDSFSLAINNIVCNLKNGITHVISIPGVDNALTIGHAVLWSLFQNNKDLNVQVITSQERAAVFEQMQSNVRLGQLKVERVVNADRKELSFMEQDESHDILFVDFGGTCDVFNMHLALTHYRKYGQTIVIISPEGIFEEAVTVTPIEPKTVVQLF